VSADCSAAFGGNRRVKLLQRAAPAVEIAAHLLFSLRTDRLAGPHVPPGEGSVTSGGSTRLAKGRRPEDAPGVGPWRVAVRSVTPQDNVSSAGPWLSKAAFQGAGVRVCSTGPRRREAPLKSIAVTSPSLRSRLNRVLRPKSETPLAFYRARWLIFSMIPTVHMVVIAERHVRYRAKSRDPP
jgi:hypothetical protein